MKVTFLTKATYMSISITQDKKKSKKISKKPLCCQTALISLTAKAHAFYPQQLLGPGSLIGYKPAVSKLGKMQRANEEGLRFAGNSEKGQQKARKLK